LGNDLLRRFNLILNYPKREIHLQPNGHFNDLFDYAYTGMSLYYLNGQILIDNVTELSPAEKAGLKADDVLIAVGNNFTNNIMQYKSLLQTANERISIVVRRNGELLQLHIKPKNIF
jgi:predicted metalloprotease with PDZ domain